MNRLRIRTFSVLALVLLLLLPWLFYIAARLIDAGTLDFGSRGLDDSDNTRRIIAAFAGLALAFFIAGAAMRRYFILPLEAMSEAARRMAAGCEDVQLPLNGIKEIAEVRDAFAAMVEGLAESNRKRRDAEEERRFVIAAIAHDLRTPLFALRGYLDGLAEGIARSPERIEKYVDVCKSKAAQLARLVEELFTFAKLEYVEDRSRGESFDLRVVLSDSIDNIRPIAGAKRIEVEWSYPEEGCPVFGDAHLLERAFVNVLDNAVRHAPIDGSVVVRCEREERGMRFSVTDSGEGFGAEELERAFDPLYRGEQSRNRSTGGAGLGLTISHRIMARHGGKLAVGNDPVDGGAVVYGWLPTATTIDLG